MTAPELLNFSRSASVYSAMLSFNINEPKVFGCPSMPDSSFIAKGIPSNGDNSFELSEYFFSAFCAFSSASSKHVKLKTFNFSFQ